MNDNYEAMSDFEIELRVSAELWRMRCLTKRQWNNTAQRTYIEIQQGTCVYRDARFCSSWNDIMPIAVEYNFDIEMPDDRLGGIGQITRYQEGGTDIEVEFTESPQRAIAICFLRLKDAQNGRI